MTKRQNKQTATKPDARSSVVSQQAKAQKEKFSFKLEIASLPWLNPYIPGIILFFIALVIGLATYKDYGVGWDEPFQRGPGLLSYNYIFYDNQELFTTATDNHGAGFELLLVFFEKWFNLTDSRDIYLMRHLVTHLFFLVSVFAGYVLLIRLFGKKYIAILGFLMLLLTPRIYAHSFFNSKDLPFLCMFIITLAVGQMAFEKNKPWLFLALGLSCGYMTSIRIMGVMLFCFLLLFLLIDFVVNLVNKKETRKTVQNMLLFSCGFCFLLYLAWPYLWKDPVHNFVESYSKLAHFDLFKGSNFINGKYEQPAKLPWTYFPIWFLITNPELWLITGFAGIIWVGINIIRRPLAYLINGRERNLLLYLICFFTPIVAVIVLHSMIYDDWRHLYFVYPSFVFLALYFIDKMLETKYRLIVQGICMLQVVRIIFFMVSNYPSNQVYFNNFVSHDKEYLRKHYEMDYWGCSFKQGLDCLLETDKSKTIRVNCEFKSLVDNNVMLLPEEDRNRIQYTDAANADYIMTNYRTHPYDYPSYKTVYSIAVLNSTILSVFKNEKDAAKQKQYTVEEIGILTKALVANPDDDNAEGRLAAAYSSILQYDPAEVHNKRAIELNPGNVFCLNNLALIYFYKKNYGQAIEWYKKASETDPKEAAPYMNIGVCNYYLGKYDSAIYYSNKSIVADPGYKPAYETLAFSYKAIGNADSVKKYEVIAKKNNPAFKL